MDFNCLDRPRARHHLFDPCAYLDSSVAWQRDRRHVSQADRSWFAKTALRAFTIRSGPELSEIPSATFSVAKRQILVFGASPGRTEQILDRQAGSLHLKNCSFPHSQSNLFHVPFYRRSVYISLACKRQRGGPIHEPVCRCS